VRLLADENLNPYDTSTNQLVLPKLISGEIDLSELDIDADGLLSSDAVH
jgi:hypothetical protein